MPKPEDDEVLDHEKVEKIVRELKTSDEEIKEWEAWAKRIYGE